MRKLWWGKALHGTNLGLEHEPMTYNAQRREEKREKGRDKVREGVKEEGRGKKEKRGKKEGVRMEWRGREGGEEEYVTTNNCKIYYLENPIYYDSDNYELEQQADSNKDSQDVYVCVCIYIYIYIYILHKVGKWEIWTLRNDMKVKEDNLFLNEVPQKASMAVMFSSHCGHIKPLWQWFYIYAYMPNKE